MRTIVAMTGASGSMIGVEFLKRCPGEKFLIVSRWGKSVLYQETGMNLTDLEPYVTKIYSNEDMNSPFSSGSNPFDQYVVLPCSMTSMARLASGLAENLIARVGEVALKEKRRMLLGIRESPLSSIALDNAAKLARLGVTIMPLSPAFYLKATSAEEMIYHFVDHVLATLGMPSEMGWRADELTLKNPA